MRPLVIALAFFITVTARAESPPIVIAPFSHRCFDAPALAARLRTQLPDAEVLVGSAPPGGHQWVQVRSDPPNLTVRITLYNEEKRVVGRAERSLVDENDCAMLLETVSLIVARAATPLSFRAPPPARNKHPVRQPDQPPPPPSDNRTPPPPPSDNRTPPPPPHPPSEVPSDNRTQPSPAPAVRTQPPVAVRTQPPVKVSDNRTAPSPRPASGEIRSAVTRRIHRHLEIDVAARWSFPLDGGATSTPGGDLTLGWRWWKRRVAVGIGVRAGVSGEWSATTTSPSGGVLTVSARRIPVAAELRVDFDLPRAWSVIRISAGPEAAIWLAHSTGLPRPGAAVFAEAAGFVRGAYRVELGPAVLTAGVDLEFAFQQDRLKIGGVGQVTETPVVQISPFVGAGVGFF